jgi:formyltetrahydrofolate synthetase
MAVDNPSGVGFVQAMTALFGETATETKEYVDKLVLEKTGDLKTELLAEIDLKEGDVTALQAAMKAFYDAVDAADAEQDGEINLADTFTSIFAKIGLNESNLGKLTTTVANLETALNDRIDAIKKAGEDTVVALAQVKENLEASIASLVERVSSLELRMTATETVANGAYAFAEGLDTEMAGAATAVRDSVRGVYGLA